MKRTVLSLLSLAVLVLLLSPARAVEEDQLRRSQQSHEKARELTSRLVSTIFDIQLRQLRENGLQDDPLYGEIRLMRENIDGLVDEELEEVVHLLIKAQQGDRASRLANFEAAREKSRDVVLRLVAERQKLLRRLKLARLGEQVRQLISLETRARETTTGLNQRPDDERERAVLATIQDQRDVKGLFLELVEAMGEVSTWDGAAGAGAADGLRILKTAQVGLQLDNAGERLEAGDYDDAAESQLAVLRGLRL
jgi:hypothetical protein